MAPKRSTVYFRSSTLAALGATRPDGLSQRIAAMLTRYERICRMVMPAFTRAEWLAIMDAVGSDTDSSAIHTGSASIWSRVADSAGDLLAARVRALPPYQVTALGEAISRYWLHRGQYPTASEDDALTAAWCRIAG